MSQGSYHHGDLRAACLRAARELLEEDGSAGLSLRAVARRAGVSATAPYRHYPDRDALVSAVAAEGYRELAGHLAAAHPSPATPDDLAAIAVAYVRFALDHPAMFRVMFAEACDPNNEERVAATAAIWDYVGGVVRGVFPGADSAALSNAVWAVVHGLAFLHLDGKLDAATPEVVTDQVHAAVNALFTAARTAAPAQAEA
ncbi:transcriptional regulator, TetR family [Saccharopolyspora kobensis]|uniref:Transcriptional regulator, TetR family n=1 Tax=Saccharopolyspora kobensis TaxID=146035 RepID=A0A1H6C962_9PSEU|nr:TetR/AcrR family transcriptional regulator [Saccharopolyspora kobensis]SEG69514.1 transcriptional regulator, TetR family [Saccharopolyspora kobensis]SFC32805.1 transcriptional regulator, TetR family [Saccharopolyspora kobensis]